MKLVSALGLLARSFFGAQRSLCFRGALGFGEGAVFGAVCCQNSNL